jgi:hypothetical protein
MYISCLHRCKNTAFDENFMSSGRSLYVFFNAVSFERRGTVCIEGGGDFSVARRIFGIVRLEKYLQDRHVFHGTYLENYR